MIRAFQRDPSTATSRSIHGEHWRTSDQLLAAVVDLLQSANWQRAGNKNAPKPKPVTRPWDRKRNTQLGSKPIPISKFAAWWDSKRRK